MHVSMRRALTGLLFLTALSGCSWLGDTSDAAKEPPPGTRDFNRFPYEQMAPEAPPPPRPEFQTPRPNPPDEYTWRKGYWSYVDMKGFVWNPGYWIQKPAFTAVWSEDFWVQRAYGWVLVKGHWE
jgi:hypothetical protein